MGAFQEKLLHDRNDIFSQNYVCFSYKDLILIFRLKSSVWKLGWGHLPSEAKASKPSINKFKNRIRSASVLTLISPSNTKYGLSNEMLALLLSQILSGRNWQTFGAKVFADSRWKSLQTLEVITIQTFKWLWKRNVKRIEMFYSLYFCKETKFLVYMKKEQKWWFSWNERIFGNYSLPKIVN